jgi:hypothetical protein
VLTSESERTLTKEKLRHLFEYDNGNLIWRNHKYPNRNGNVFGHYSTDGYLHGTLDGQSVENNRLVYIYHHGSIPVGYQVDHIDRVKDNNRIENLRLLTPSENNYNTKRSDYARGYIREGNKFKACISIGGKSKHLGTYDTPYEAHKVFINYRELLKRGLN